MNVKRLIELLEDFGEHLEVYLDDGSGESPTPLDLDANNFDVNRDGHLVINL